MATNIPPYPRIPFLDRDGYPARQWLDWFSIDLPNAIVSAATGGNTSVNIDDIQTQLAMEFCNDTFNNRTGSTNTDSTIEDLETRIAMGTGE